MLDSGGAIGRRCFSSLSSWHNFRWNGRAKAAVPIGFIWLGILVVTDISVFGWLISNLGSTTAILLWAAGIAVVGLTSGILLLHRRIERNIESLRGL
jgi:hypothetical protein